MASKLEKLFRLGSIAFWVMAMYYAYTQELSRARYAVVFLGSIISLYSINEIIKLVNSKDEHTRSWRSTLDWAAILVPGVIFVIATIYIWTNFTLISEVRVGYATDADYIVAALLIFATLILITKEFGSTFLAVILAAIIFARFGEFFPGALRHANLNIERILQMAVLNLSGVYGRLTQLIATWVALFILYAGLLRGYGAFEIIIDISMRSTKYIKSGIAQSSVLASMIIGSINGSAVANTAITGSFTIPIMKESGMDSDSAAAIESVASTGGQIIPPVMGAIAFLMAALLGRSYVEIIIAGIAPAIIFYAALVLSVHLTAIKEIENFDINPSSHSSTNHTTSDLLKELVRFGIPFFVLILVLGVLQFTVMTSALLTCITMMVTGVLWPILRNPSMSGIKKSYAQTVDGFAFGVISLGPIAIIIAAINIAVDLLVGTGMPSKLSLALIEIAGGQLWLAALLAMVICIALGLGMPSSAAYLLVALLVAPTLINQFMVPDLAAHFFVFLSAVLASITPPIATGVAVATGISGGDFWKAAFKSLKLALPLFIFPFAFIYHPVLVDSTISLSRIVVSIIVLLGSFALSYGVNFDRNRYKFGGAPSYALRGLYVLLGILGIAHPDRQIQVLALVSVGGLLLVQTVIYRTSKTRVELEVSKLMD